MIAMMVVILGFSAPVFAEEDPAKIIVEERPKTVTSSAITRLDNLPEAEPNWFRANIHATKKHGFEFSRSYTTKGRDRVIFSLKGPMLRKKTAGLTFEIRF